jgi:hypothetical protein
VPVQRPDKAVNTRNCVKFTTKMQPTAATSVPQAEQTKMVFRPYRSDIRPTTKDDTIAASEYTVNCVPMTALEAPSDWQKVSIMGSRTMNDSTSTATTTRIVTIDAGMALILSHFVSFKLAHTQSDSTMPATHSDHNEVQAIVDALHSSGANDDNKLNRASVVCSLR